MIVQTSIDAEGGVTVSVDSDGDQGDAYSTEVLDDMISRAGKQAIVLWLSTREPAED